MLTGITIQRIQFKNSALVYIALVFLGLAGLTACGPVEECGAGVPRHARHPYTHKTCPLAGRMGAFKLAIPKQYIFLDFGYKGFDIWTPKTHAMNPKVPTLDNELVYFSIFVRRNNFEPIVSAQDQEDAKAFWKNAKSVPLEKRWLTVSFEYVGRIGVVGPDMPDSRAIPDNRGAVKQTQKNVQAGRYIYQKRKIWGLDHYVSINPPSTRSGEWHNEYFYDTEKHQTIINCETALRSVPPHIPLTYCNQNFSIVHPQTKDVVNVSVNLDHGEVNLADWRVIEQEIRNLFNSFTVH